MAWELVAALAAVMISLIGLGFVAYQTRMSRATAEMTLNLAVMERLDGVLLAIAERPEAHAVIWSKKADAPQDNGVSHVLTQSLIDVLELSLTACRRVPGFSQNAEDWRSYAAYVLEESAAVRNEVESNPKWWPRVAEFLTTGR